MLPPPCQGGMISSSSSLAYTTPMPVGPKILCPEKTKKSQLELLHVDRHVRHRLGPVDQHAGVVALGHLRHFGDRQDRAQAVRGLRQGDQPGARPEQRLVLFEHDLAAVG